MIEYILNPHTIEALGWTLLHSLWQGAVFAILLALILIALRSYTAQSRYVVAVGLLCTFFLTVSATFYQQWVEADSRFELAAKELSIGQADDVFTMDKSNGITLPLEGESKRTLQNNNEKITSDPSSWLIAFRDYYGRHLPLLVTIWFLGILFLQLRFLGQLAYVQRLKHYGTQIFPATWSDKIEELEGKLRIQKKVAYLTSIRVESPMVIGWLKPVVLVPRQLLTSLTETEMYAVLAHELAHIRREDFVVNLLQTFLCNVFFFHPGVWWMSHRIDDEREHCCDDLAVAATGPATSYAKTLINVSELQLRLHGNTPLAMALSGKSKKRERGGFSARIRRLFTVSNVTGTFREGFATACILIIALFLGAVATGRTIEINAVQSLSENDKTEIISDKETSDEVKTKLQATTTTTVKTTTIEDGPISNEGQDVNGRGFPIATPVEPVKTVRPINIEDETRIDALVMACGEGDFDFVKTLIKSGIDVNGIGSEGFTPLMMASSNNKAEIVNFLIEQGADVNKVYNGWTALIEAADEGSMESMKHLLNAGAEVNYYASENSPTAITMAASEGNLECLKLLIKNGADMNGIGKSIPPLHIAAAEGKQAIIDYLISKKVNINNKDAGGRTALMYAASEGQKYVVKKLIEAGADMSIVDPNGSNASDYAEEEEEYETKRYLANGKNTAIHQATLDGHIEKVKRMVEQGTDIDSRDIYGRTPLHLASAKNYNLDMRVLIDLGANINALDEDGRTPLMYAAADGSKGALVFLVSKLADVNIKDEDGMTAYDWAIFGRNSELIKFLGLITENKGRDYKNETHVDITEHNKHLQKEKTIQKQKQDKVHTKVHTRVHADVNTRIDVAVEKEIGKRETLHLRNDGVHLRQYDLENNTPKLLQAARNGSLNDCANLIGNGLPVNSADATGQTALMVAVRSNRFDIAKYLIEQGADVNRSSASGLTALHWAALENHDQIARLLLDNNAKVDPTMRYSSTDGNYTHEAVAWEYIGATPLLIAVESQNIQVISVLLEAGANKNKTLLKNEYQLSKNRVSYLSASEVMGIDEDFLKEVDLGISDKTWTPFKQALLLKNQEILSLFKK